MIGLGHAAIVNEQAYKRVVKERRFMISATIATSTATVMFIVAMSLPEWVVVSSVDVRPDKNVTRVLKVAIWGEWVSEWRNDVQVGEPKWIPHFPHPPPSETGPHAGDDSSLPHFYRTQAVFACIGLILMLVANCCAVYSLHMHRYMYKRLTAGLHFVTALSIVIVIEVMVHSMDQWHTTKEISSQKGSNDKQTVSDDIRYSYSTVLSWFVFAIYAVAAVVFVVGSRKRKGSRAATQEFEVEDRPFELGRP